jgi:hypothetical protein
LINYFLCPNKDNSYGHHRCVTHLYGIPFLNKKIF